MQRPFHLTGLFLSLNRTLPTVAIGPDSSLIYPTVDKLCKDIQFRFTPVQRPGILNRCILYSCLQITSCHSLF